MDRCRFRLVALLLWAVLFGSSVGVLQQVDAASSYAPVAAQAAAEQPCSGAAVIYAFSQGWGTFACYDQGSGGFPPSGLTCETINSNVLSLPVLNWFDYNQYVCNTSPPVPTPVVATATPAPNPEPECQLVYGNLLPGCNDILGSYWTEVQPTYCEQLAYGTNYFPLAPSWTVSAGYIGAECGGDGGGFGESMALGYTTGVGRIVAITYHYVSFSGTDAVMYLSTDGCNTAASGVSPTYAYITGPAEAYTTNTFTINSSQSSYALSVCWYDEGSGADQINIANPSAFCTSGCGTNTATPTPYIPPPVPSPNATQAISTAIAMATYVATYLPATPTPLPSYTSVPTTTDCGVVCEVIDSGAALFEPHSLNSDFAPIGTAAAQKYPCCNLTEWSTVFPAVTPNACGGGGNPLSIGTPGGDVGFSLPNFIPSFTGGSATAVSLQWDFCPTAYASSMPMLMQVDSLIPEGRAWILVSFIVATILFFLTYVRSWFRAGHNESGEVPPS